jgi:glyoxylase-like metal-dependent hydrolase (beta-lactamase superfamily II)
MVVKKVYYENKEILEWKWASDNELIPKPFYTSCFLVDGILIDAAAPASANDFREFITPIVKDGELSMCILTHTHEDHCGCAYILQQEFNIPIYAHEKAISFLKKESSYPEYRQITWGEKRLPVKAKKYPPRIISQSGKYEFETFPMPGHAPYQVAFIEKSQEWAFVADGVQNKYKMIFGASSDIQEDISVIYDSIKKLYNFTEDMKNLKIFIAGHGLYEGRQFLKERLKEIDHLHHKIHRLYKEEEKNYNDRERTLKKVLKRAFKRESLIGMLTKGDLSAMNLIKSLLKWALE